MGDEGKKRDRTTAKRLFTRCVTSLQKAISDPESDSEIISSRFKAVNLRWEVVQESHESYIQTVDESEVDHEDEWITDLQNVYEHAEMDHMKIIKDNIRKENVHKVQAAEMFKERQMKEQLSEGIVKSQKLLQQRTMEEVTFNGLLDKLTTMISQELSDDNTFSAISDIFAVLKNQFERCKVANTSYMDCVDDQSEHTDIMSWTTLLQDKYLTMVQKFNKTQQMYEKLKVNTSKRTKIELRPLQLEPMKLPSFQGDVRKYPRFKSDFEKYILPTLTSSDSAAYIVRTCLKGVALDVISNVDDNIDAMWSRLDEKFGKPSKLIDLIMSDFKGMKVITDGNDKKFVDFVDLVERGYRDLKMVKYEKEIANSTVIGIIEAVLPKLIRREWSREVNRKDSSINEDNKFVFLLEFLLEQKRILEYQDDSLRVSHVHNPMDKDHSNCLIHKNAAHNTAECTIYLAKTDEERVAHLRENTACFSCLSAGHTAGKCMNKQKCPNCPKFHHPTLHEAHVAGIILHTSLHEDIKNKDMIYKSQPCLLQVMRVKTVKTGIAANVLWDGGATDSLITFNKAKLLKLNGQKVSLSIVKVGGQLENIESYAYHLPLRTAMGETVKFRVYGIDKISSPLQHLDVSKVTTLFDHLDVTDVCRPEGEIDVLIGLDYAAFQPQIVQSTDHLVLVENRFGKCLSGKHHLLRENTEKIVSFARFNHFFSLPTINEFFSTESLGIACNPQCGSCKCGKCPIGGKDYTLQEERELMIIDKGLQFKGDHWVSSYPWVRDPADLPDNRVVAIATLRSTEKRLLKNEELAAQYKEQMKEMLDLGVSRKLSRNEMMDYKGPVHYLSHHEVMKKDSTSTPCRVVFNASANYKGHILNEYWAKGPSFINNLLGILLRLREEQEALVGDIRRMYHTVKLSPMDQQTHRYVWRDLDTTKYPETYVLTTATFGDKPAAAISSWALRKTAIMNRAEFPEVERTILNNTYVDDILKSVKSKEEARQHSKDIEKSIGVAGFKIKAWSFSGDSNSRSCMLDMADMYDHSNGCKVDKPESSQKVLGVQWDPFRDVFFFKVKINFSPKKRGIRTGLDLKKDDLINGMLQPLTKRIILSQVNGVFDPLGLVAPFTVRSKILLRRLWAGENKSLGWDDDIPSEDRNYWREFFIDLFDVEDLRFDRCIRPVNAAEEHQPSLIIFSDASEKAYGCCTYIRWKLRDNSYKSNLICAKTRVAPVKISSIVRLELNGALLAKRIKVFIETEMELTFKRVYFLIDSKVVLAMINKESYGFRSYAAVRIGEIQQSTNLTDWYWLESELNISDWVTRGKRPAELNNIDQWQNGPAFLSLDEAVWPITQNCSVAEIPELIQIKLESVIASSDKLSSRINIERFSSYLKLIFTTARVLSLYRHMPQPSLYNVLQTPTSTDLDEATNFWIQDAQSIFTEKVLKERCCKLSPKIREDGIIVVGMRVEKWLNEHFSTDGLVLLPYDHRISRLYSLFIHNICHSGLSSTVCKIRSRFWIIHLPKLVKSIVNKCVPCKIKRKKNVSQVMSPLPLERMKPAPAWHSIAIDYFGPMVIRGEVSKRSRGTSFGVIFNSLEMRAVHLDLVYDCSTDSFLMCLRRFASIRGWPSKILSDNGSQFRKASKQLRDIVKDLDWQRIIKHGAVNGVDWKFTPPDAPWHNGCSEALIRSTKSALKSAIHEQVLSFSELQTVLYEVANILNERPIGRHPSNPDDGAYLCPNDLLLGRASSRIPGGPFAEHTTTKQRYEFTQGIVDSYWRKMTRDYFPSLLIRPKWHVQRRNVAPGDIVIIQDSNLIRGEWRLGRVTKVMPSDDDVVRKCQVQYKLVKPDGVSASRFSFADRAVQRLVVLIPVEEL